MDAPDDPADTTGSDGTAGSDRWRRLNRAPDGVPGVMSGDIAEWLGTLDEQAVARVLEVYRAPEAKTASRRDVAEASGIDLDRLRAFGQALGLAPVDDDALALTAADVELLTTFVSFFAAPTREQGVGLQMARVLGSNLDRVASAQVDMLVARVLLNGPGVDAASERSRQFSALMPRLLELVWRHHLGEATERRLLRSTVGDTAPLCVGFADLVGFTATAAKLNQLELARIVGWFEAEAFEVVAAGGGRVVKTIGDEVMFVAEDVRSGTAIAIDLAQRFADDPVFPDVHVGVTAGPVVQRRGDVYGPTVNRAARIVGVALPGTVLVDDEVHRALAGDPAFDFRASYEHHLDGVGEVTLWRVRRPGTPGPATRALADATDARRRPAPAESHGPAAASDTDADSPRRPGWREATEETGHESTHDEIAEEITREITREVERADAEAIGQLRRIEDETVRRIATAQATARAEVTAALADARVRTDAVDAEVRARIAGLLERVSATRETEPPTAAT